LLSRDIAISCQNLTANQFLILEDAEGNEFQAPFFKLKQCDCRIPCLIVIGKGMDEDRFGHSIMAGPFLNNLLKTI